MSKLKAYLSGHPLVWVIPVLVFLVLAVVSWMAAHTPDLPPVYRL